MHLPISRCTYEVIIEYCSNRMWLAIRFVRFIVQPIHDIHMLLHALCMCGGSCIYVVVVMLCSVWYGVYIYRYVCVCVSVCTCMCCVVRMVVVVVL